MAGLTGQGRISLPKISSARAAKLPAVKLLPEPKISLPSVKVPKIQAVHIHPASNGGFQVIHKMHIGRPKQFVFSSPAKMLSHLRRIERNEWLKPMANPAPAIAHVLDIGLTP